MHSKNCLKLPLLVFGFLFLTYANSLAQKKINVSGYVYAQKSKETIAGVTITVAESSTGTVTNNYGFYSLEITANKNSVLHYSVVEFETS